MTTQTAAEPILSLKARTTPAQFAGALRARGPIFRADVEGFWVVTSHELALTVLKDEAFSADRSAFFEGNARASGCPFHKVANFFGVVKKMMVNSDAPHHTARRKLAAFGLADSVVDEFRPAVARAVEALLAKVAGRDLLDFVADLALPLPNTVLADLFSVPEENRADFYRWANDMTQFFGGGSGDVRLAASNADEGAAKLGAFLLRLVAERRAKPQRDFISRLVAQQAALGLDDSEVVSQAAMMLVAGTVTTTDQMANDLAVLLAQPGLLERLREEPSRLDAAIEEATRLDPSVNFVFRAAKRDVVLGEAAVKAGELVFVSTHAANRDPRVFERPDELRLDRTANPHLSYGAGAHYCLGAKLGRIQLNLLISSVLRRFGSVTLSAERRKHQSLGFSGFESLILNVEEA